MQMLKSTGKPFVAAPKRSSVVAKVSSGKTVGGKGTPPAFVDNYECEFGRLRGRWQALPHRTAQLHCEFPAGRTLTATSPPPRLPARRPEDSARCVRTL